MNRNLQLNANRHHVTPASHIMEPQYQTLIPYSLST